MFLVLEPVGQLSAVSSQRGRAAPLKPSACGWDAVASAHSRWTEQGVRLMREETDLHRPREGMSHVTKGRAPATLMTGQERSLESRGPAPRRTPCCSPMTVSCEKIYPQIKPGFIMKTHEGTVHRRYVCAQSKWLTDTCMSFVV